MTGPPPSASPGEDDQRLGRRIPLGRAITMHDGTRERGGWIRDISVSGCFIETQAGYPTGTVLTLSFKLEPDDDPPVTTKARVASSLPTGLGMRFVYNDAQTPLAIKRWIGSRRGAE